MNQQSCGTYSFPSKKRGIGKYERYIPEKYERATRKSTFFFLLFLAPNPFSHFNLQGKSWGRADLQQQIFTGAPPPHGGP